MWVRTRNFPPYASPAPRRCWKMKEPMGISDPRVKALGIAGGVFALDRLSKWLIETRVSVLDVHNVIPGFFDIIHSSNRGVAFSLFHNSTSPWRTTLLIL